MYDEKMEPILRIIKKIIPVKVFRFLQPIYHYKLALLAALFYGFPSRKLKVIGVTGTKGKSSTVELLNSIFETAGHRTAVAGTIRFKIDSETKPNLFKMTMPGRFAMQKFLADAARKKCDVAIIEMTSEGVRFFRHKFIALDSLVFTNISPEHIESHGSFEKYLDAKLEIARSLSSSSKKNKVLVANRDDEKTPLFVAAAKNAASVLFGLEDAKSHQTSTDGVMFVLDNIEINSPLPGLFNIYNMLAAAATAKAFGINMIDIKSGLEKVNVIRGRVEKVNEGQNFEAVVDYAHTIDSLQKFYQAFPDRDKICVLGNTGGGRDKWKRTGMAEVAENNCRHIILTNEDPYDEDPRTIVEQMASAIKNKSKVEIIMDRREAIAKALSLANDMSASQNKVAVLISGKGTDPYIMLENGKKQKWSDEAVTREELRKMLKK